MNTLKVYPLRHAPLVRKDWQPKYRMAQLKMSKENVYIELTDLKIKYKKNARSST